METTIPPARIRFWVYANGTYSRVTLRADQSLEHCEGGPTDEGFHYAASTWWYDRDAGLLRRNYYSRSRDCDGLYEDHAEMVCPIADLAAHDGYSAPWIKLPLWQLRDEYRRDHSAERAGY